jgi:hypothetical protein
MRALIFLFLLLGACTPNFQSASQVQDLRVLAVAADPPEAFVDVDGGTVQDVRVAVLVADPSPRAAVDASASLCVPTDNLICDQQRIDLPAQHRLDPGEIDFTVSVPAPLLVAALQNDKIKVLNAVAVQFTTAVADGDPAGAATAEKVLVYSTSTTPNHSPRIASVEISRGSGAKEQLPPGGTLLMGVGEQVGIRPLVGQGPDGAETYTTTDLKGNVITLTEQLNYTVFTTLGGEWDKDRADEPFATDPTPPFGIVRFDTYAATSGTMWIVVRDGRGGLSWFSANWTSG